MPVSQVVTKVLHVVHELKQHPIGEHELRLVLSQRTAHQAGIGQDRGSSFGDAEAQQRLLVPIPRCVLLFEASHLRLMNGP